MQPPLDDHESFVELYVDGRPRLGHLRGLDGLRGLAVAAVVAFHAGFDRMVGGYLGVSTFFTLSGFLIASLLFAGASEDGVVLRGFWGRRFRRLFPASVVTLIAVLALFVPFVATADQLVTLRGDSLAALFNVANWRFIIEGSSYGDLFSAPSPVLHFWSLAIEEQFYLVFPLLLWLVIRVVGGRRALVGGFLAALAAGSLAWTLFGGLSEDHIYFGTGTRASELLLGGVLAVILTKHGVRSTLADKRVWRMAAITLGLVALGVQMWLWWGLEQSAVLAVSRRFHGLRRPFVCGHRCRRDPGRPGVPGHERRATAVARCAVLCHLPGALAAVPRCASDLGRRQPLDDHRRCGRRLAPAGRALVPCSRTSRAPRRPSRDAPAGAGRDGHLGSRRHRAGLHRDPQRPSGDPA